METEKRNENLDKKKYMQRENIKKYWNGILQNKELDSNNHVN